MALVWYARLEGYEFRTVSESVNNQGRPRELLGQLKRTESGIKIGRIDLT